MTPPPPFEVRRRAGETSSPDSGDLPGYADRVQPSTARPGLIDRHDLVAALDHAAEKKATVISAPAGSGKTSLLRVWAGRPGQDRRIALMSVRPGRHDAQLFWLTLLGFR